MPQHICKDQRTNFRNCVSPSTVGYVMWTEIDRLVWQVLLSTYHLGNLLRVLRIYLVWHEKCLTM